LAGVSENIGISEAFPAFTADQVAVVGIGFPLAILLMCFLIEFTCFSMEIVTESSIWSSSRSAIEILLT